MARRKKRSTAQSTSTLSAWIWLTLGILIGLGIAWFTRINGSYNDETQTNSAVQQQNAQTSEPSIKPKFDFYALLPELEVVIPEDEKQPFQKNSTKNEQAKYTGGYLLQVGSFQQYKEADSLKAHLALLGVEAHIQSVNINNSKCYCRNMCVYVSV